MFPTQSLICNHNTQNCLRLRIQSVHTFHIYSSASTSVKFSGHIKPFPCAIKLVEHLQFTRSTIFMLSCATDAAKEAAKRGSNNSSNHGSSSFRAANNSCCWVVIVVVATVVQVVVACSSSAAVAVVLFLSAACVCRAHFRLSASVRLRLCPRPRLLPVCASNLKLCNCFC